MNRLILLLLCCGLLAGCVPADGPFGRMRDDVEEGLRKTAEDLRRFEDEVRDSRDPDTAVAGLPLRMLVIVSSHNLGDLHQETLLSDLHREVEDRGFEIIHEDVPALQRYRDANSTAVQRLRDLAGGLPTGSFGVVEVFMNGWDVSRRGSLSHSRITGYARFTLTFRVAAHWRHVHPDDDDYWERRITLEREVNDRQLTLLEDQVAQSLNMPRDIQYDPELRATYLSGVIAEAFASVAPTMPRPSP